MLWSSGLVIYEMHCCAQLQMQIKHVKVVCKEKGPPFNLQRGPHLICTGAPPFLRPPLRITSLRAHFRVITPGQNSFFQRKVAAVASHWQGSALDLNFRFPASETNTSQLDQLAGILVNIDTIYYNFKISIFIDIRHYLQIRVVNGPTSSGPNPKI